MTAIISCPACKKKFKGKPELVGKKIRCPKCEHVFVVQALESPEAAPADAVKAATSAPASAAPAAPPLPGRSNPFDDEDDGKAYGVTVQDLRARCPVCANPMESEEAIVCLFCGYNTQTRQSARTIKAIEKTFKDYFLHLLPGIISVTVILLQTIFCLWLCLIYPFQTLENSLLALFFDSFTLRYIGYITPLFDHESVRMWVVIASLFDMWALGYVAYWRLIINPFPPEKIKQNKKQDKKEKSKDQK